MDTNTTETDTPPTATGRTGWAATSRAPLRLNTLRACAVEWRRPWKLFTLAIGIALLVAGANHYRAPDWDVPISFIMAILAYLTAPWSLRTLIERRWRDWPLMLFLTWFTVDGCYAIYWHFRNPVALELMREANFPASLSLYGMCGLLWLYRGSLRELVADTMHLRHSGWFSDLPADSGTVSGVRKQPISEWPR